MEICRAQKTQNESSSAWAGGILYGSSVMIQGAALVYESEYVEQLEKEESS